MVHMSLYNIKIWLEIESVRFLHVFFWSVRSTTELNPIGLLTFRWPLTISIYKWRIITQILACTKHCFALFVYTIGTVTSWIINVLVKVNNTIKYKLEYFNCSINFNSIKISQLRIYPFTLKSFKNNNMNRD